MWFGRRKRDEARIKELEEKLDQCMRERTDANYETTEVNRKLQECRHDNRQARCHVTQLIKHLGGDYAHYPYKEGDVVRMEGSTVYVYQKDIWVPSDRIKNPPLLSKDTGLIPQLFPMDGDRRRRGRFIQIYHVHIGWEFEPFLINAAGVIARKADLDTLEARRGDFVMVRDVSVNHEESCFVYTEQGWESVIRLNQEAHNLGRLDYGT